MTALATKSSTKTEFEFYVPEAQKVNVAGTFNDRKEEKALSKGCNRKMESFADAPCRPLYEYRYLVDGIWQND